MVFDNVVCERWFLTKWCVKEGVSKMVCERWCVTKSCVKDGVWKMLCDKVVCVNRPNAISAPPEPAQCHKCKACHAKRRWMWPRATPATRDEGGCHQVPRLPRKAPRRHRRPNPAQARHQSQPSALSATPATQNESRCHEEPRLPRERKADVAKCHACHAKCRGVTGDQTRPKRATRASPVP